jgi:methionyl-tRNA formyltransferase
MFENNLFYIDKIELIVFIGFSENFKELIEINKNLNIPTEIITSTDQSSGIKFNYKTFDKIDSDFYKYFEKKHQIDKTLYISLGSRLLFNSDSVVFFKGNLINFHGTRLPYDSGGGGFSWKIMRQDRIDNQLVHLIDDGIDTGPIIANYLSIFPKNCVVPLDFEKYRLIKFLEFYKSFIFKLLEGHKFNLKHQIDYIGRYNPRLSTLDNGFINWEWEPFELYNFINSFDEPYPGSMTFINRGDFGPLHIKSVHLHGGDSSNHPYMTGLVSRHDGNWIVVSTTGKYSLLIEKIIDLKGENIISSIKPGDRFYTPKNVLDNSISKRIIFNSKGKKN